MAIILMMFKITMAWVSQFIQSALVEKNYSKRWTKTGSCPWRMHGAKSRLGAYTITRDVPILRWAGWRHLNLLKSLPFAWICSQHEAGYSWLWLEHIRGQGQWYRLLQFRLALFSGGRSMMVQKPWWKNWLNGWGLCLWMPAPCVTAAFLSQQTWWTSSLLTSWGRVQRQPPAWISAA